MEQRTCFVISPIGPKDSQVRKLADDVFDLIIEPALEAFSFKVIRADKLSSVASITSEIVELVQKSDLCVIDITGHNPNVMYECGRRHETGKPYIMIASAGEKLPFDISSIRTIFYDTAGGREILGSVRTIQAFVRQIIEGGLQTESSGESLSSIAATLQRIERRLNEIPSGSTTTITGQPKASNVQSLIKKLGHIGAFNYALTQRDADIAESLIPHLEGKTKPDVFLRSVLCQAAALGSRISISRLESHLATLGAYDESLQGILIGSYVQGLSINSEEQRGIDLLRDQFERLQSTPVSATLSAQHKALMLNQYQKLLHGIGNAKEAVRIGEIIIALAPDDPAYFFNQSLNQEMAGNLNAAVQMIDRVFELTQGLDDAEVNDSHVQQAVELYAKAGLREKATRAFRRLQTINPYKAVIVQDMDVVRAVIDADS